MTPEWSDGNAYVFSCSRTGKLVIVANDEQEAREYLKTWTEEGEAINLETVFEQVKIFEPWRYS